MIAFIFLFFTIYLTAGAIVVMFDLTSLNLRKSDNFKSRSIVVILYIVILWPAFVKINFNDRD
jgi:hypothetical protein